MKNLKVLRKEKHELFLDIAEDIYDYYSYLEKHNLIDFNDMINDAVEKVEKMVFIIITNIWMNSKTHLTLDLIYMKVVKKRFKSNLRYSYNSMVLSKSILKFSVIRIS